MNTDSLKRVENPPAETETSSGWDPYTVWRERVHKPRAKAPATRPVDGKENLLVVLNPVKRTV